MPELPEVETIRLQLIPLLEGRVLRYLHFRYSGLLQNARPQQVKQALEGYPLQQIQRFGKFLIFGFPAHHLVFHLGMSGIFIRNPSHSRYPQHIHVEMHFEGNETLFYQDFRKFGKIWLYGHTMDFSNYGIDPFDQKFTLNHFRQLLHSTRRNIKLFLMDQHFVVGIGNIYANEILFTAGILPTRRTDELTPDEEKRLFNSIQLVLKKAIAHFGTTYSAYRTVEGESGKNQHFLKVYHREGEPCERCGNPIQKIILGSRSTFFCANCQK